MNRWIGISIIGVLVVGLIVSLSLFFQTSGNLKDAKNTIASLEGRVTDLESDLVNSESQNIDLENELAAIKSEISKLTNDLELAGGNIAALESHLADTEAKLLKVSQELELAKLQEKLREIGAPSSIIEFISKLPPLDTLPSILT